MARAKSEYTVIMTSTQQPGKIMVEHVSSWTAQDAVYDAMLQVFDREQAAHEGSGEYPFVAMHYDDHGVTEGTIIFQ